MKDETILAVTGIAALTIIEVVALIHGINHSLLAGVTAIIAGLAGYEIRKRREET